MSRSTKLTSNVGGYDRSRIGATIGHVVAVDAAAHVWVDYAGNELGPLRARRTGSVDNPALCRAQQRGSMVVLVFEDGDPRLPLILAISESSKSTAAGDLEPLPSALKQTMATVTGESRTLSASAPPETLSLQAAKCLELRCGDASITLRADGSIKLRGVTIASLARRLCRIRAGTVSIN